MSFKKSYRFRIAGSEAGLAGANFFIIGLPEPVAAIYNDHSATRSQGEGGLARHGYNLSTLLWTRLSLSQARILDTLIDTAEATAGKGNGVLFLTLPKTLAEGIWIDVSGVAIRPDWANLVDPQSEGRSYANIRLDLNNSLIVNEPSTVS